MKTLELERAGSQWRYRVLETFDGRQTVRVDWQFGPANKSETIKQAEARFGPFGKIIIEE